MQDRRVIMKKNFKILLQSFGFVALLLNSGVNLIAADTAAVEGTASVADVQKPAKHHKKDAKNKKNKKDRKEKKDKDDDDDDKDDKNDKEKKHNKKNKRKKDKDRKDDNQKRNGQGKKKLKQRHNSNGDRHNRGNEAHYRKRIQSWSTNKDEDSLLNLSKSAQGLPTDLDAIAALSSSRDHLVALYENAKALGGQVAAGQQVDGETQGKIKEQLESAIQHARDAKNQMSELLLAYESNKVLSSQVVRELFRELFGDNNDHKGHDKKHQKSGAKRAQGKKNAHKGKHEKRFAAPGEVVNNVVPVQAADVVTSDVAPAADSSVVDASAGDAPVADVPPVE